MRALAILGFAGMKSQMLARQQRIGLLEVLGSAGTIDVMLIIFFPTGFAMLFAILQFFSVRPYGPALALEAL